MRGRKPTSNESKELRGQKRYVKKSPKPEGVKAIRCPSWLPSEAKKLWHKLAPQLTKFGLLTKLDHAAFEALCVSYSDIRQAEAILAREGITVDDARGSRKKHPAFTILKNANTHFLKFAQEFGLTPISRSRLDVKPPEPDDNYSQWKRKKI